METLIDLEAAAAVIENRRAFWKAMGIEASETTWRDQGRGWPPPIVTDRRSVLDPDSIGVELRKGEQEGSVVLFKGGWADFLYWDGESRTVVDDAPGWEDSLDLTRFDGVLDRLTSLFR